MHIGYKIGANSIAMIKLREKDSNLRPSAYETAKLPLLTSRNTLLFNNFSIFSIKFVHPLGLEPMTPKLKVWYSSQLSYEYEEVFDEG